MTLTNKIETLQARLTDIATALSAEHRELDALVTQRRVAKRNLFEVKRSASSGVLTPELALLLTAGPNQAIAEADAQATFLWEKVRALHSDRVQVELELEELGVHIPNEGYGPDTDE